MKQWSLRPPLRRVLSASAVAVVGALAVTLFAQSYPAYDRNDEGEIWEYVGTIGRSIDHCFSTTYPRNGGTVDPSLCPTGPEFGDLFEPTGLAAYGNTSDGTYRLYVADRQNRRVVVFGPQTSLQGDPYANYLDTIAGWDADGNHLTTTAGAVGTFGLLEGVAVDAAGNVLVADATNARVVVFNSSLQYLFELALRDGAVPAYFAVTPGATIELPSGADPGNQSNLVLQSPTNVDASPGAQCASGIPTSGRIALGTYNPYPASGSPDDMNVVIIYDERMCEVDRIGTGTLDGSGDFVTITGMAFERAASGTTGFGRLYVSDYGANESPVYAYAPNAAATDYPAASAPSGRLVDTDYFVWGVAIDQENRIVVTEPDNQRIAVFTRTWTEGATPTVAFASPADLEIRAAGQISDMPIAIAEDSAGRLLVTAGANGSDVVHVIEQPSLAVFDVTATVLDAFDLFNRRVHVEFKVATPSRQTASRTNVIPQASAIGSTASNLSTPTGPTPVTVTDNGTTYSFPTTAPGDPLHIPPGDYAVYSFEFAFANNTFGSTLGDSVTIAVAATSDGPVNAPAKSITVVVPDPECDDHTPPTVTFAILDKEGNPLSPVSGVVQGVTKDIYSKDAVIRLSATDTGGSTQLNLRWKFTDGPRSAGQTWTETGFVSGSSVERDVAVIDSSVLTSSNHTLSYEVLDMCANTSADIVDGAKVYHSTTIFIDVLPPGVLFDNAVPVNPGSYPETGEKWWNTTTTVGVRGTDDDTSASNVTLTSASPFFALLSGRTDAGVLTFTDEGGNNALVRATDKVGNGFEKHSADTVGLIRIDKTAPAVTVAPATPPNVNGWYKNDVDFNISAEDANTRNGQRAHDLSGLKTITSAVSAGTVGSASMSLPAMTRAAAPNARHIATAVTTLSGEGRDLQVSASAEDFATNVTPPVAAAALVNIDKTKPTVSWAADKAEVAGFYQESVVVTLTASDALSGINRVEYSTDGVSYSSVAAATATLALTSTTTLRFRAVDNADNVGGETVDISESTHTFKINHKPSIVAHALTTDEDVAVSIDLLTGATDPDSGTTLTVTDVSGALNGSVSLIGSTATFTPAANYFGTGSFSYTVSDGNGGAATATVSITVISVNDPPVAVNDAITILEDAAPTPIDVLANDSDVETPKADLVVMTFTQGTKGTVSAGTGQTLLYAPAANANGIDTFAYTIRDADGATAIATVTVTITPVNDAPVAADDSLTIAEDTAGTVNVLANDTDVDGDLLSVQSFTQGAHGVVSAVSGGLRYTPAANYYGPDAFTYVVSDGNGGTATATVTVTVTAVPDAPTAVDDTAQLGPNSSILIDVRANDFDADNLPPAAPNAGLVIIGGVPPENGTAVPENTPSGVQIRYTPNGAFVGTDTFQYTIDDGTGLTDTATVSVLVNTPPVCTDAVASIPFIWPPNHSQIHQIFVNGVTDPNGDPITITITKIEQDEPVDSTGDGEFTPDGAGVGTSSAWLRAERMGGSNGRVYEISFRAGDGRGGECTGAVKAVVPHDMGPPPTWTDDGVRYDSTETVAGTRPGQPRNPRASARGRSVTLSWDPPQDEFVSEEDATFGAARAYSVIVGTATGGSDLGSHDVGNVTSFTATLPAGTYYARVIATNYRGSSDPSDEVVVQATAEIPGAPGLPTALITGSSVIISWTPPTVGAAPTSYTVAAGSTPGGQQLGAFDVGLTTTLARTLRPGTYYVRVVARGPDGNGPASAEMSFTIGTPAPGTPGTPVAIVTGSSVTISWSAPSTGGPPSEYSLVAGTTPGSGNVGRFSAGLSQTFTQTLSAGTYYVRIIASNEGGDGPTSPETAFTIAPAVPHRPGTPQVTVLGQLVTMSWQPPASGPTPTGFTLIAGTTPGGSQLGSLPTGLETTTTFTFEPGTYYIRVVASNVAGTGEASEEMSFVVHAAPGAPAAPEVHVTGGTVRISWTAPTTGGPLTAYRLLVGTNEGGSQLGTFDLGDRTSITVDDVPRGTYYIRVIAVNATGDSPASPETSFTVTRR